MKKGREREKERGKNKGFELNYREFSLFRNTGKKSESSALSLIQERESEFLSAARDLESERDRQRSLRQPRFINVGEDELAGDDVMSVEHLEFAPIYKNVVKNEHDPKAHARGNAGYEIDLSIHSDSKIR